MTGRTWMAAAIATAAVLAGAQPAHAMRTYVNYDSLVISASPGEVNALDVRPDPQPGEGPSFLITDPGATITAGPGCARVAFGRGVRCTLDASQIVASLSLSLNDRGDVATVRGDFYGFQADAGAGNDRLDLVGGTYSTYYTGPTTIVRLGGGDDTLALDASYEGWTEIYGDAGTDDIRVSGETDWIQAGDGNDTIDASGSSGGTIQGEGGDDRITGGGFLHGGDGADRITGGWGWDRITGDDGDDEIDSWDLSYDDVDCGTGTDSLVGDEGDAATACEAVKPCGSSVAEVTVPDPDCALRQLGVRRP